MRKTTPHKKLVTVVTEYWDCGKGHNHLTEEVAIKCHEKYKDRKPRPDYKKRNMAIMKRWLVVGNMSQVGREYNLSSTTIYTILHQIQRHVAWRVAGNREMPLGWSKEYTDAIKNLDTTKDKISRAIGFAKERKRRREQREIESFIRIENGGRNGERKNG